MRCYREIINYTFIHCFAILILCTISKSSFAQPFTPGTSYFDSTGFVEYIAGDLPVVFSVPHGGYISPDSIPNRDCSGCSYLRDSYTQEIGRGLVSAFFEQTGCYPHVIINLLHRRKFDANRDIGDAADGNPLVEAAWYNYHEFIDSAKNQIIQNYDRGIFLDIHGHAHTIQRIELGYLLSGSELRLSDATLNTPAYIEESSLRTLVGDNLNAHTHAELLRGSNSFGTLMEEKNFPCVPSMNDPFPNVGDSYFSGGYNTVRHGSRDNNGDIDAIQIECNQDIRFNATLREMLIDSLTLTTNQYLDLHYDNQYFGNFCNAPLPVEFIDFNAKYFKEGHIVQLIWNTASEVDNEKFEIEFSKDGYSFQYLKEVAGSGNTFSPQSYESHHKLQQEDHGTLYYRLKQFDYNGHHSYSPIESISIAPVNRTQVFPTILLSGQEISLINKAGTEYEMYDSYGRLINANVNTKATTQQIETANLSAGIYWIKTKHETFMISIFD